MESQRKKTLLVEYRQLRKANTFIDRRFGGATDAHQRALPAACCMLPAALSPLPFTTSTATATKNITPSTPPHPLNPHPHPIEDDPCLDEEDRALARFQAQRVKEARRDAKYALREDGDDAGYGGGGGLGARRAGGA